jgi:hypothetical protein
MDDVPQDTSSAFFGHGDREDEASTNTLRRLVVVSTALIWPLEANGLLKCLFVVNDPAGGVLVSW